MASNEILAVYALASAADRADGMAWYGVANAVAAEISDRYGVSMVQAIGVIAALSPRNRWERNVLDAENMVQAYVAGGAEAAQATKCCTFGGNKAKAVQILQLDDATEEAVLEILSGPKLREFFCCINGWVAEVCIDGHAYSIWTGGRVTLANVPSIGKKLRETIKADYRSAAREVGISPSQMQAVTWCAWRRIHEVV
ncbi:MAG: DUF7178 family protein [Vulcanococcus sp.]